MYIDPCGHCQVIRYGSPAPCLCWLKTVLRTGKAVSNELHVKFVIILIVSPDDLEHIGCCQNQYTPCVRLRKRVKYTRKPSKAIVVTEFTRYICNTVRIMSTAQVIMSLNLGRQEVFIANPLVMWLPEKDYEDQWAFTAGLLCGFMQHLQIM